MNASAILADTENGAAVAQTTSRRQSSGQFVHISAVPWEQYEAIGQALLGRPAVRLTYDRGELEIMVTSEEHEGAKKRFARLVETLTFALRIPIRSRGSMTFQRKDL